MEKSNYMSIQSLIEKRKRKTQRFTQGRQKALKSTTMLTTQSFGTHIEHSSGAGKACHCKRKEKGKGESDSR